MLMDSSAKTDCDAMRGATPARLDVGRAVPRYTTPAMLALRADHARAVDAVMTTIPRDWARRNDLIEVHSEALGREDYLRYPERGRRIAAEDVARVNRLATPQSRSTRSKAAQPAVLVCVGDGLSSAAIEKNAIPLLKALQRALKSR